MGFEQKTSYNAFKGNETKSSYYKEYSIGKNARLAKNSIENFWRKSQKGQ